MVFVFFSVFILWTLLFIAVEVEDPFGSDANDLDGKSAQEEFNCQMLLLAQEECEHIPSLSADALPATDMGVESLCGAWQHTGRRRARATGSKYFQTPGRPFFERSVLKTLNSGAVDNHDSRNGQDSDNRFAAVLSCPPNSPRKATLTIPSVRAVMDARVSSERCHESATVVQERFDPGDVDSAGISSGLALGPCTDAQSGKGLGIGARVVATETFMTDNNGANKVEIAQGVYGIVRKLDEQGDALILFEGESEDKCVFRRNFHRLKLEAIAAEVESANTARTNHFVHQVGAFTEGASIEGLSEVVKIDDVDVRTTSAGVLSL
jgi:hypothetical protein